MKKQWAIFLIALAVLSGCAPARDAGDIGYRMVSEQDAITLMEEMENYIILDVRTPEEYAQRHIPGAINIPNEAIGSEAIPELPDREQTIFIYCRSGNRSKQAAEKLSKLGYTGLIESGGINNWPGETVDGETP